MNIRTIKKIDPCCPPSSSFCCAPPVGLREKAPSCCAPDALATVTAAPCCGPAATVCGGEINEQVPGFLDWLETPAGRVPRIATDLTFQDRLGACKARWAIGRMTYIVPPGLYALGNPTAESPVVVTANYKMSYDIIRSVLAGRNIWLLVLETFGVNVWCAAGKGTFGTAELVERLEASGLAHVVTHRKLILPILGAPGVAAHEVTQCTGFHVRYATIRANDLPDYLDNGMVTTPAMGRLTFTWYERLVLVPVELVMAMKSTTLLVAVLFAAGLILDSYRTGLLLAMVWVGAMLTGVVAGPLLLPWLPGKSFALKGAVAGLAWSLICFLLADGASWGAPETVALFLAAPTVSAYHTLNFTGCTTYTSPSGVRKEMRFALPVMAGVLLLSGLLLLTGLFI